jgi:hypothetical protein
VNRKLLPLLTIHTLLKSRRGLSAGAFSRAAYTAQKGNNFGDPLWEGLPNLDENVFPFALNLNFNKPRLSEDS